MIVKIRGGTCRWDQGHLRRSSVAPSYPWRVGFGILIYVHPPKEGTGIYTSASRTIKASSCINQYFYLTVDLFTWKLNRSARLYPSIL